MIYYPANASENASLMAWCADHIPYVRGRTIGPGQAIASVGGGALLGVAVFHDWQSAFGTLQVSCAAVSPRWALDVAQMFDYAFTDAKAMKLWAAIPHDNTRALRFNAGLGFKSEATLRHHFGNKRHAVICSMLRQEWARSRWCARVRIDEKVGRLGARAA